jgi:hypothetical protein
MKTNGHGSSKRFSRRSLSCQILSRKQGSSGVFCYIAVRYHLLNPYFRSSLRDGRSIRTVSALLLQLVQTSAHDVRIQARKIEKARQNKFALRRQESLTESQTSLLTPEPFLDDNDHDVRSLALSWLFAHLFVHRRYGCIVMDLILRRRLQRRLSSS